MADATAEPEAADADDEITEPAEPVDLVHGAPRSWSRGQEVLHPTREQLLDVVRALRDDGYLQCLEVWGVDYLTHPGRTDLAPGVTPERFEVVVALIDHHLRRRIRLRVQVPASEPTCPSLFSIHPGTEQPEREVYDLFGIEFEGHPGLVRILMPDDWVGHPLRKDYATGEIPVQFKGASNVR
ncbi:MAG TPA: NADH-quinone oxidoreductase subunit C [Microthrixaceae bacterium]|nr:NADH-quinone oxidoreductase subunit C [Microthrixaceae bacterium]